MRAPSSRTTRPEKPLTPAALERSALWHLSRRALTRAQLQGLLQKKAARAAAVHGPRDEVQGWIDALLARLQDSLLVDDARVARARVESGRAAGRSRRALQARLRRDGVDAATAAQALQSVDNDRGGGADAELHAGSTWARKKSLASKDRTRALAALARQGFSFDIARRALDAVAAAAAAHGDEPDVDHDDGAGPRAR
ncbi:MAG: RecX family transcriptional regulator [Deltaproteobacteria bacterium]|nr:RecX family transcriptional regulator [Deltaproteobacteria bacterium]